MNPLTRIRSRWLPLVVSTLVLSGCSIVPTPQTVQSYVLPTGMSAVQCPAPVFDGALRVQQPRASQFLSSSRIAVRNEANEITVYKGARWNDSTPVLVRDALVQSLQRSNCLKAVVSDEQFIQTQAILTGELYAFEGDYRSTPAQVHIRYVAYLVDGKTHNLLASRDFEVRQPVTGQGMDGAIEAFGQAVDTLSAEVSRWVSQQPLK